MLYPARRKKITVDHSKVLKNRLYWLFRFGGATRYMDHTEKQLCLRHSSFREVREEKERKAYWKAVLMKGVGPHAPKTCFSAGLAGLATSSSSRSFLMRPVWPVHEGAFSSDSMWVTWNLGHSRETQRISTIKFKLGLSIFDPNIKDYNQYVRILLHNYYNQRKVTKTGQIMNKYNECKIIYKYQHSSKSVNRVQHLCYNLIISIISRVQI